LRFKIQKGEALQQLSVETLNQAFQSGVSEGRLILLHKPVGVSFVRLELFCEIRVPQSLGCRRRHLAPASWGSMRSIIRASPVRHSLSAFRDAERVAAVGSGLLADNDHRRGGYYANDQRGKNHRHGALYFPELEP
jgi:hypothetical protein